MGTSLKKQKEVSAPLCVDMHARLQQSSSSHSGSPPLDATPWMLLPSVVSNVTVIYVWPGPFLEPPTPPEPPKDPKPIIGAAKKKKARGASRRQQYDIQFKIHVLEWIEENTGSYRFKTALYAADAEQHRVGLTQVFGWVKKKKETDFLLVRFNICFCWWVGGSLRFTYATQ